MEAEQGAPPYGAQGAPPVSADVGRKKNDKNIHYMPSGGLSVMWLHTG